MATVNFTGYSQGSGSVPTSVPNYDVGSSIPWGLQKLGLKKCTVDFTKTGITNTNADVIECIYCPAGTKILDAWFIVTTPEVTQVTAELELGLTGVVTDGFVAEATVAVAGLHATNNSTFLAAGSGYTLTTADTIDLLVSHQALAECVVDVYALVLDLNA